MPQAPTRERLTTPRRVRSRSPLLLPSQAELHSHRRATPNCIFSKVCVTLIALFQNCEACHEKKECRGGNETDQKRKKNKDPSWQNTLLVTKQSVCPSYHVQRSAV